jgi:hypothetical protein
MKGDVKLACIKEITSTHKKVCFLLLRFLAVATNFSIPWPSMIFAYTVRAMTEKPWQQCTADTFNLI